MKTVVKLGGSLATSGTLRAWLGLLRRHGGGRSVIVPGGGVFADAIRAAQAPFGFSDRAAHSMAVLAMEQYAILLNDLEPELVPCAGREAIEAALAAGGIALWRPRQMVESDPLIPASWNVTSDSLAAWLAERIGAARLVLIKSAAIPAPPSSPESLAEAGIVDPAFPGFVRGRPFSVACIGPGDEQRLASALATG
jgi:aspartokinase-like uncharacterized kinase